MMHYCPTCRRVGDEARCARCGEPMPREVQAEDLLYLTETSGVWAAMLIEAFDGEGIPYLTEETQVLDTALAVAQDYHKRIFYVPHAHMERATEVFHALFGEEAEDTAPLGDEAEREAEDDSELYAAEAREESVSAAFSGELTGEARRYACRHMQKVNCLLYSFMALSMCCLSVAVLLAFDPSLWFIPLPMLLLPLLAFLPVSKTGMSHYPTEVTVYETDIKLGATKTFAEALRAVERVRYVIATEECYVIVFPGYVPPAICQRSNLTEGSLEAFERVFNGKIKL